MLKVRLYFCGSEKEVGTFRINSSNERPALQEGLPPMLFHESILISLLGPPRLYKPLANEKHKDTNGPQVLIRENQSPVWG